MPEVPPTAHLTSWACPSCHRPISTTWLFCETCGTDFRVSRPGRLSTPVPLATLPAHVVQTVPVSPPASIIAPVTMSFTVRPDDHDGFLDRLRDRLPGLPSLPMVSASTRTLVQMLAGLLVLVLIGVALTVHLQTRADLHRTQRELATSQGQLASTQGDLAASRASLANTRSDLDSESAKLDDAKGSLDDANDKLNLQSGQIDTLKTCLAGVNLAFSDFLNDDYDSALDELYAVQSSCDEAYALF